MTNNYNIGKGRPPVNTQFKKGKSGNPKGRPKKSINTINLIESELGENVYVKEGNKQVVLTKQQAIIKQMINKALKGDTKAILYSIELMKGVDAYKAEAQAVMESIRKDDKSILENFLKIKNRNEEIEDV